MHFLFTPEFWTSWLRIVLIDLLLAGDNALVIALAVRSLPPREQLWGRLLGTGGAVVLRLIFVTIITYLLTIPLLRGIGGALLIAIAIKLVRDGGEPAEQVRKATSLRQAVGIIILADVVMSLDNVIAIAGAARGDLVLVTFGLLLSIPLVVWGSGFLASLMNRFPVIIWLGGGVLGWVAVTMITDDPLVAVWLGNAYPSLHGYGPCVASAIITLLGWSFARASKRAKSATAAAP